MLAVTLNWFTRPKWATTGRMIAIVIACVVVGALVPLLLSRPTAPTVSVDDVAGSWQHRSVVGDFTTAVDLTIGDDGAFSFAMNLNVTNAAGSGDIPVACQGTASPEGDGVVLKATSGSCGSGLTAKPGPTDDTLYVTGADSETMTLVRAG